MDVNTGIGVADEAGNKLDEGIDYRYSEAERSYYALNIAVTAANYQDFTDSTKVYSKASHQLDTAKSPEKKVWLNIYNASDNFLSSTYQPLLQNYDDLMNLKVDYIGGDGQTRGYLLHLRPRRCRQVRLRLQGTGRCRVFSMSAVYEKGSDGP